MDTNNKHRIETLKRSTEDFIKKYREIVEYPRGPLPDKEMSTLITKLIKCLNTFFVQQVEMGQKKHIEDMRADYIRKTGEGTE